jgi:hypothetical protein
MTTGKGHYGVLAGLGLMLMLRGVAAQAMQAEAPQSSPEALPVQSQSSPGQESQAQPEPGGSELLHLLVGQTLEVSSPSPIKHFSMSSPGIIDATQENPNQLRIDGKAPGSVSLVVQDDNGQAQIFYVYVELKDAGASAQLPDALPDDPAPVQVPKRKTAWLGWAGIASLLLLAGALFKVVRQREPYKLDLRSAQLVPPDSCSEPALPPHESTRLEEHSAPQTAVPAAPAPTEDLEKVSQEQVEQWWRQFRTEAEAAVAGLREESQTSGKALEESEQRLACLAEARMASLWQATQEEFSMRMALALKEHEREMRAATAAELESLKKAAGEAVAQLEAAEDKSETGLATRTEEAEKRLAGMSMTLQAVEERLRALAEGFEGRIESSLQALQGKVEKQGQDLEKLAQELEGRWSEQFQKQAAATIEKLREETNRAQQAAQEDQQRLTGRAEEKLENLNQALASAVAGIEAAQKKWMEEGQRQLSSVVEAKVNSLSQFAVGVTASLEAEHKQLKSEYETSRREFEQFVSRRSPAALSPSPRREIRRGWQGTAPRLTTVTGILLATALPVLAVYLWPAPVMRLQAQPPAEFVDESATWGLARRAREQELARAFWQAAVSNLQVKYPYGTELPAEPPSEFDAGRSSLAAGGAKALSETREHYWLKLRKIWVQRESWVETSEWDTQWASRLKHLWGQSH